jgi:membrane protein DedA with SNARE-associated domain
MLLHSASITGGLVNVATHLIQHAGYWGIFTLTFVSTIIFVPGDEVTMLFGGYAVVDQSGSHAHHHLTIVGIIIAAIVGDLLGAGIAFFLGRAGLYKALERLPGPLKVEPHGMEVFNSWFERWGMPVVVVSRFAPVIRGAGPYAAGIAKMSYSRFVIACAIGTTGWMIGLGLLGDAVGHEWQKWKNHLDYVDYVAVVIIVAAIAWFLYKKVWKTRGESQTETV